MTSMKRRAVPDKWSGAKAGQAAISPDCATSPKRRATELDPEITRLPFDADRQIREPARLGDDGSHQPDALEREILPRRTEAIASRRCSIVEPIAVTRSMLVLARTLRATTAENNASLLAYRV